VNQTLPTLWKCMLIMQLGQTQTTCGWWLNSTRLSFSMLMMQMVNHKQGVICESHSTQILQIVANYVTGSATRHGWWITVCPHNKTACYLCNWVNHIQSFPSTVKMQLLLVVYLWHFIKNDIKCILWKKTEMVNTDKIDTFDWHMNC